MGDANHTTPDYDEAVIALGPDAPSGGASGADAVTFDDTEALVVTGADDVQEAIIGLDNALDALNTEVDGLGGGSGPTRVVTTVAQTKVTDNTLALSTELRFTPVSGVTYRVAIHAWMQTESANPGAKVGLVVPAGSTGIAILGTAGDGVTAGNEVPRRQTGELVLTTGGTHTLGSFTWADGAEDGYVIIYALFTAGAATASGFAFSQKTSHADDTILKHPSYLEYEAIVTP